MAFGEDDKSLGEKDPNCPKTPAPGSLSSSSTSPSLPGLVSGCSSAKTARTMLKDDNHGDRCSSARTAQKKLTPCGSPKSNENGGSPALNDSDEKEECYEVDQMFDDHEEMCCRLERQLGLRSYKYREQDDWKELACLIGSRFDPASHFYPTFASRVARQKVSPSALLLCLIYMERLHVVRPEFPYEKYFTTSDLFLISLMTASKYLHDVGESGDCYNGAWSKEFGIPIKTINKLEMIFLNALDWNLHAEVEDFHNILHKVNVEISQFGCDFRDFLTYSDLLILSDSRSGFSFQPLLSFTGYLVKMMAALTTFYMVAGLLTVSITSLIPLLLQLTPSRSSPTSSDLSLPFSFGGPNFSSVIESLSLCAENSPFKSAIHAKRFVPFAASLRMASWNQLDANSRRANRGRFLVSAF